MVQDIIDGILEGLTDFIGGLGASLLDFIISLIALILNIIITPINALLTFIFPDLSNLITNFNNGLNLLLTSPIGYFAYHIPPITRTVISVYLVILIGYYSVIWTYRGIILIPRVIQKIKFW